MWLHFTITVLLMRTACAVAAQWEQCRPGHCLVLPLNFMFIGVLLTAMGTASMLGKSADAVSIKPDITLLTIHVKDVYNAY